MSLEDRLGPAQPLREWLSRLGSFPGDGWLVICADTTALSLDTACRPVVTDGRDLSDAEHDALDAALEREGLRWFLSEEQLQGVRDNLVLQVRDYSAEQLLWAVQHYWTNDAFVQVRDA